MVNFNNPQNLNLSNSFSTVSATLENPAYGDFRSADPGLAALLPKNLNYGITSPGTVNMETQCNGLDFVDVNVPDFSRLPFQVCLDKFSDRYQIPEIAFNNLMNSLPYTFSALSKEEQTKYLNSLQNFISEESSKSNHPMKAKTVHFSDNKKEKFGSNGIKKDDCLDNNILTNVLYISIIVIMCLLFLIFYLKK